MIDISIVTATFNRAHFLSRVWRSLKDQSPEFEWIIIDDASKDNTENMVKSFCDRRIVYVRHPRDRGGPNAGRNQGARMARGKFVVFLDDDDELYPGSMEQMVTIMDQAVPTIGVAMFQCVLDNGQTWKEDIVDGAIYDEADLVCRRVPPLEKILVYRREVFESYELPEDLRFGEGVFVFAVAKSYRFLMVAQPGRIFHQHASNSSDAKPMIANSRMLALSYERILSNHSEVLKSCHEARAFYIIKALYRHTVAGQQTDARRLFRALFDCGSVKNLMMASGILLLGFTRTAKLAETLHIGWIRRRMYGGGLVKDTPSAANASPG